MALPLKKDICIGIFFVIFGLVMAVCDRWQLKMSIQGSPTRKPHAFNHTILVWFLRMLMQFGLLYLWKAIDTDWCGFARFRHGDQNPENRDQVLRGNEVQEEQNPVQIEHREGEQENPENRDDIGNILNIQGVNGPLIDEEGVRQRRLFFPPRPVIPRPQPRKQTRYTKLIYFPPAFFDVSHVLLVFFGIQLTYTSSFIMLKGTMPFFAAILLVAFLARQLALYIWVGVVLATLGVASLGISDYITKPFGYEKYGIAAGDLQIAMGQIMFATKLIYEEKFIGKHSIHPMKFLGSEASYGLFFASVILLVFNLIEGQISEMPNGHIEDVVDFCYQLAKSWKPNVALAGSLCGYQVYTYLGLFLVRDKGALPRIMLELIIWVTYWAICIGLGWEHKYFVAQGPGLVVTLIGLLFYAHILALPFLNYTCGKKNDEVIGPDDNEEDDDEEMLPIDDGIGVINEEQPLL